MVPTSPLAPLLLHLLWLPTPSQDLAPKAGDPVGLGPFTDPAGYPVILATTVFHGPSSFQPAGLCPVVPSAWCTTLSWAG